MEEGKMEKLKLRIEKLEERIAPWGSLGLGAVAGVGVNVGVGVGGAIGVGGDSTNDSCGCSHSS